MRDSVSEIPRCVTFTRKNLSPGEKCAEEYFFDNHERSLKNNVLMFKPFTKINLGRHSEFLSIYTPKSWIHKFPVQSLTAFEPCSVEFKFRLAVSANTSRRGLFCTRRNFRNKTMSRKSEARAAASTIIIAAASASACSALS